MTFSSFFESKWFPHTFQECDILSHDFSIEVSRISLYLVWGFPHFLWATSEPNARWSRDFWPKFEVNQKVNVTLLFYYVRNDNFRVVYAGVSNSSINKGWHCMSEKNLMHIYDSMHIFECVKFRPRGWHACSWCFYVHTSADRKFSNVVYFSENFSWSFYLIFKTIKR